MSTDDVLLDEEGLPEIEDLTEPDEPEEPPSEDGMADEPELPDDDDEAEDELNWSWSVPKGRPVTGWRTSAGRLDDDDKRQAVAPPRRWSSERTLIRQMREWEVADARSPPPRRQPLTPGALRLALGDVRHLHATGAGRRGPSRRCSGVALVSRDLEGAVSARWFGKGLRLPPRCRARSQ